MIVNDNVLDKLLDRIRKIIYINKFDFNKMKVDADDKLPNDITENENMMVLIMMVNVILKYSYKKHCMMNREWLIQI